VMLPHLMGAFSPVPNPSARGAFSGFTLSHTRGHFVRAVLEGVAFMLRQNLDTLRDAGLPVLELRSTGGGSRSPVWNQIKADVCRIPVVTLMTEDTALLGDAILAGVACDVFGSVEQGCREMVQPKCIYSPGEHADLYDEPFRRYDDLDQSLAGHFRRSYAS
jgi:sugar (pentulose or hexulose) kinase